MMCTIRRMNESDIDAVHTIETSVHLMPWSKNILRDCILVGYHCLVLETVINKQSILSGYVIFRQSDSLCHILNFCIAKSFQSKGYGRQFLQKILHDISQLKEIEQVVLEVRPSNHIALHLYESLGFKQVEIKHGYYDDNTHVEDALVLKKTLHTYI